MAALARLSITLEPALLARLGRRMRAARAGNRSKFLADLIRRQLVEETWAVDGEALGTITRSCSRPPTCTWTRTTARRPS